MAQPFSTAPNIDPCYTEFPSYLVVEGNEVSQRALHLVDQEDRTRITGLIVLDGESTLYPEQAVGFDGDDLIYATSDATTIPKGGYFDQLLTSDPQYLRDRPPFLMKTLSLQGRETPVISYRFKKDDQGMRVSVERAIAIDTVRDTTTAERKDFVKKASAFFGKVLPGPHTTEHYIGEIVSDLTTAISASPEDLFLRRGSRYRVSAPLRELPDKVNQSQLFTLQAGYPYQYAPRQISGIRSKVLSTEEKYDIGLLQVAPEFSVFKSLRTAFETGKHLDIADIDTIVEVAEVDPRATWHVVQWLQNLAIVEFDQPLAPVDPASTRKLEKPLAYTVTAAFETPKKFVVDSTTETLGIAGGKYDHDFLARLLTKTLVRYNDLIFPTKAPKLGKKNDRALRRERLVRDWLNESQVD